MAVTVVLDHRRASAIGAGGRAVAVLVGLVLLGVALAIYVPAFVIALLGIMSMMGGGTAVSYPDVLTGAQVFLLWLAGVVVAGIANAVGLKLVRGRRRLLLVLRRFGHRESTHALTVAAASIGGFWRLVTLDDAQLSPVGVGAGVRGLAALSTRAGPVMSKIGKVASKIAKWGISLGIVGGIAAPLVALARGQDPLAVLSPDRGPIPETYVYLVSRVVIAVVIAGFLVWLVSVFARLVLMPVFIAASFAMDAVREAESARVIDVPTLAALQEARQKVLDQSRRVFSARLAVLKVDAGLWQSAVRELATVAHLPLIDVSEPTENVLWEVEELSGRFGHRCVFVGQYERLGQLTAPSGSPAHRLASLLDGHEVLGYTTDKHGTTRFVRALRGKLEAHAQTDARGLVPPTAAR